MTEEEQVRRVFERHVGPTAGARSTSEPLPSGASRRLPVVAFLREQIKTARALSPEQPGVIRLSCFDAEDVVTALEALRHIRNAATVGDARQLAVEAEMRLGE